MRIARLDLPPEPIEIAAGSVQLRPWQDGYAPDVLTGLTDPEWLRWSSRRGPASLADAVAWIRRRPERWREGSVLSLAVMDTANGALLGEIELTDLNAFLASANVGYWTMPSARGRGVATAAVAAITRWAFEALHLHRLEIGHAPGNIASCRVAERCDFVREGVLRSYLPRVGGGWFDIELHARIAPEAAGRTAPEAARGTAPEPGAEA